MLLYKGLTLRVFTLKTPQSSSEISGQQSSFLFVNLCFILYIYHNNSCTHTHV